MIAPDVRVVLFDAVGTLICPDPPVAVAYHRLGREHGSRIELEEIGRRFRQAFARQEAIDRDSLAGGTSEARELARWEAIVAEVFDDAADQAELFRSLWQHFAEPANWHVYADVAPAWDALARRGLAIGVASNFDARLDRICDARPELARCRLRFISSRLGFRKPDPRFFTAIERALELRGREILLVGDDLENDCLAARSAGWQTVLLQRDAAGGAAAESIVSLSELFD